MLSEKKRTNLRALFYFLLINLLITILMSFLYLFSGGVPTSFLGYLFLSFALIANFIPIYLILAIALLPFYLITDRKGILATLTIALSMILHILCFVDTTIFRIFKIHINSMVLNLLTTEGAGDTLYLGGSTIALFVGILIGMILFEIYLYRRFIKKSTGHRFKRRGIILTALLIVAVVLPDKIIYAVSDLYNLREVTRFSRVFPLYQPVTIKGFMIRNFDFQLDREDELSFNRGGSGLNYPRKEIVRSKEVEKPNIVWVLVDAMRYDMLNEKITPHIFEFTKKSRWYKNHYSGGNASRFGVFSLFYGLNAYYWHQFLGERQSPVLIDELIKLNYDFKILSSTRLTFPEFRKTAFVKIPEYISDQLSGADAAERDPVLTSEFIDFLDKRDTTKPFFSFMFYDAPHGPSRYPDSLEYFTPASNRPPNYITLGPSNVEPLKNGYKNAVRFDDAEVGRVISALEQRGLLENTIVLISGDHGQEFYESGFYGHTSSFSRQQTQVPMVLYLPGDTTREINYMTSHLDVVPTIMNLLGYDNDPSDYSQGRDMLEDPGYDFVMSSGWDDCAIITKDHVFVFSSETYNMGDFQVRDRDYKEVENRRKVLEENRGYVLDVLRGFEEFIK